MIHQTTVAGRSRIRGFTLIELMLVVTIIAILVALLLPAVQQAREAARRTQCKNNLMQLTLALHSYQVAHVCLPPGSVNDTGPIVNAEGSGYHMSWIVQILPMIDQGPLFQAVDFTESMYSPANSTVRSTVLPTILCPSDDGRQPSITIAVSNYAGCTGGQQSPVDVDNTGLLFLNSSIYYKQIRDGASNTLVVGERVLADISGPELGWMSGTASTLRSTGYPMNLHNRGSWNMLPAEQNAPTVGDVPADQYTGGFGSQHAGGAQFGLADGSVRFLSENIAAGVYSHLGDRDDGEILGDF